MCPGCYCQSNTIITLRPTWVYYLKLIVCQGGQHFSISTDIQSQLQGEPKSS